MGNSLSRLSLWFEHVVGLVPLLVLLVVGRNPAEAGNVTRRENSKGQFSLRWKVESKFDFINLRLLGHNWARVAIHWTANN